MENRTDVVRVRCRPEERKALELVALMERRNLSEMLRELVREGARERGLWPPDEARLAELREAAQ